jgi:hypothetical protein
VSAEVEKALRGAAQAGAILVDLPELPNANRLRGNELEVLLTELKASLPSTSPNTRPHAP